MSEKPTATIDGRVVTLEEGWMVLEAAEAAGIWVPRLCHLPGLEPWGSCRLCTVRVNDRLCSACTEPVVPDAFVEVETEELQAHRRTLVEMLFVEGNHYCMFCEKSGRCELQALAYRLGIHAPTLPYLEGEREVDASHPDILLDRNRCILCARCVRTSRDLDGKHVFGFSGRGSQRRLEVNAEARLADTEADVTDRALDACPVGALLRKRRGYEVPQGERPYDHEPIGSEIEGRTT